uniref:NADH dehydrogenase subunit 5 n=1 Tax=Nandigallia matai TaxID=1792639 RepID=UPI0030011A0D|nr:NADH dehydrogenase subunit 5 [Nandigallia matai]
MGWWVFMIIIFFFFFFFFFFIFIFIMDFSVFLEFSFLSLNSMGLYYVIYFDWVSLIFLSVVLLISSMVILYSCQYMGYMSYSYIRFLFLLVLFVFSMILMVLSPNMLSILLGWDGLGLVSYLLVIYYSSSKSYFSGLITFMTNRLGDIGLLISICWGFSYGSWHLIYYNGFYSNLIYFLLILSSFTSSAQIPFSCWLPAAMAAPTPVSSLVHSSTLVTAGVYLLFRFFSNLILFSNFFLFISLMTMFFSSFCANYEFDLKSIIALSTLSQLGLMMSSLFLGLMELSYFHLLTHAMFKSMLFLCSGIFIYYMFDNQDIRMMGFMCINMPLTTSCFNIANLALCGIPFLSGFYSKDLIVELSVFNGLSFFVFLMIYFSLGMTCCYSFRLFYYSVIFENKFVSLEFFSDSFDFMKISVMILGFFSLFFGSCFSWVMNYDLSFLLLPLNISIMTLLFIFMGFMLGLEVFSFGYLFSVNFYFMNSYMWFMNSYFFYFYGFLYKYIYSLDFLVFWGEFYGGYGLSMLLIKFSSLFQVFFMSFFNITLISFFLWFFIML